MYNIYTNRLASALEVVVLFVGEATAEAAVVFCFSNAAAGWLVGP